MANEMEIVNIEENWICNIWTMQAMQLKFAWNWWMLGFLRSGTPRPVGSNIMQMLCCGLR